MDYEAALQVAGPRRPRRHSNPSPIMPKNPFKDFDRLSRPSELHPDMRNLLAYQDPPGTDLRNMLAAEANRFAELHLTESSFFKNLPKAGDYKSKLWEMRLGLFLHRYSDAVRRGRPSPDFIAETKGHSVNVEATSASRGEEGKKRFLRARPEPVQVTIVDEKIVCPKIEAYRPNLEGVAARIEARMGDKIEKNYNWDSVSSDPTIFALDITETDDEFHSDYIGCVFWGLGDATCRTFNGRNTAIISKFDQVTIPGNGVQTNVGFFRLHRKISGVILGRSWRYEPLEGWMERNNVSLLINPWATRPVPESFLERMPRVEKIAQWISNGAIFNRDVHALLPEPLRKLANIAT